MNVLGWVLVVVGVVFGVVGGVANLVLAQNYAEFLVVSLPVAIVGLSLGRYCLAHGRDRGSDRREVARG